MNTLFEEALYHWLSIQKLSLKGASIYKYQYLIDTHIAPNLGKTKLAELTAAKINSFLLDKYQNGRLDSGGRLAPSYIKTMQLIIKAAYKLAVEEDLCLPLKGVVCSPTLHKKEIRILSIDDQLRLEKYLKSNISPTSIGILISLYTGLRIGEICALSWDDVDMQRRIIHVRHTITRVRDDTGRTKYLLGSPKTNSSLREIPIFSTLFSILSEYEKISVGKYIVSSSDNFIIPRTFEYRYHVILKNSNVPDMNYHVLRHTFATRCVEAGVDIKSLSDILGHASVSITLNTYVHSSMELKRKEIEKLIVHLE